MVSSFKAVVLMCKTNDFFTCAHCACSLTKPTNPCQRKWVWYTNPTHVMSARTGFGTRVFWQIRVLKQFQLTLHTQNFLASEFSVGKKKHHQPSCLLFKKKTLRQISCNKKKPLATQKLFLRLSKDFESGITKGT